MTASLLFLLLGVTTGILASDTTGLEYIRTSATAGDRNFYDEAGRVRIFHGGNRVPKFAPWYFDDMLQSDNESALMKDIGFNVVRLGFMWSGYNPAPNVFNTTYIAVIKQIVSKLNARGVYVLLDLHQDVMSSKFCTYDGFPRWVVDKSSPKHPFPWPLTGNCSRDWEENDFAEAPQQAYQDFYDNHEGMLDDLAAFWAEAASAFKDMPGIIGYEIMNEPFPGNLFADVTLALPGEAGRKNLQRMNDKVAAAITQHDDKHVIFYEPVTWGMIFDGNVSGSGFEHVPGGKVNAGRAAFSFHYYCGSWLPDWQKAPAWRKAICDATMAPLVFAAVEHDLERLGGSAMMTEGLACGGNNRSDFDECVEVMDGLDEHLYSWTDYGDSQGALWQPSALQQQVWARSYARAVAGMPLNMTFDDGNPKGTEQANRGRSASSGSTNTSTGSGSGSGKASFEFCWTLDTQITASTEIFASTKYHYPNGVVVRTTPNVVASPSPTGNNDIWTVDPTLEAAEEASVGGTERAVQPAVACVWLNAK